MFEYVRKILTDRNYVESNDSGTSKHDTSNEKQLQVATAAVFIEMAKADGTFTVEERKSIVKGLHEQFNLDNEYIEELLTLSEERADESISIYEFSNVINENFSSDDKFRLLKNLWRLIYTDERLDGYEDRLIKIIGGMLMMDHQQIIDAKLLVRKELNLKD
ncbi:TerB family tellurite resistance protein [bacterium BMS3Abin03]|jgi:uncharacterized tellurite resistance protein B-like protein|nr:TerB family tellurite resistance protein [bacterium BMS3Abin03]MCG6959895.1 TerB family tellurite resistance protein [bacterium BMS3Abin03]